MAKSGGFSKFRSRLWAFCEIERQIRRQRRCTSSSLASDLSVSGRTVRRYVAFMRDEMGAPIEYDPIDETYTFTSATWTMPNIYLSEKELLALAVSVRSIAPIMPSPFTEPLAGLLRKLLDALPESKRDEIHELQQHVDIVPVAIGSKGMEWVEPLLKAMRDEQSVEINYYIFNKRKAGRRVVDPYHLRFFTGTWYLIGYDHHTRHFPVFNLARIRDLQFTEKTFRRREFSAADYFRDSVGIMVGGPPRVLRLLLSARAAETAGERNWPNGFTYRPNEDGTGILTGRVSKLDDILAWVGSVGGEAAILPDVAEA
jgi:predicted DNA-binding transcriptional regulator YafY